MLPRLIPLLFLCGCYKEPATPEPAPRRNNICVQVINGRYLYFDDCEVPQSTSQAVLPP